MEHGGYASDLLLTARLDSRDAGLASEIVFGVLRYRAQLDFLIDHHSGRRVKLDIETLGPRDAVWFTAGNHAIGPMVGIPAAVQSVPTQSPWGGLPLAGLLGGAAVLALRRVPRHRASAA